MSTTMLLLVVLSAVIHASWNYAAKRVSGDLAVLWIGQLVAAVLILPAAVYYWDPSTFDGRALVHCAVTTLVQAAYFVVMSRAYAIGDLSVVYPVARGSGVAGAALIGTLVLAEPVSVAGLAGMTLVCAGCLVMGLMRVAPGAGKSVLFAIALGCTLVVGATNDKLAVERLHPVFYIACMYILATFAAYPLLNRTQRAQLWPTWRRTWRECLLVGPGSLIGYLIILYAFQLGPLGYVVALREMSVVLGAAAGVFLLKEQLSRRKVISIGLIVAGLLMLKAA